MKTNHNTQTMIQIFTSLLLLTVPSTNSTPLSYTLPVDKNGYTAMHHAALKNDTKTIEILAKACPNEINRPSEFNFNRHKTLKETPFDFAVLHKNWKAVTMLVAFGAEPDNRINNCKTTNNPSYIDALKKGCNLKSSLKTTAQTSTSATQTESHPLISRCSQTDPQNTHALPTDHLPSYKEATQPPPYSSTLSRLFTNLNPEAKPFIPTSTQQNHTPYSISSDELWTTTPKAPHTQHQPEFPTMPEIELERSLKQLLENNGL